MSEQELLNGDLVDPRFLEDIPRRRKRPDWILRQPIAELGSWETLFDRRRTGVTDVEDDRIMRYQHSEEFVRYLKGRGVNLFVTSFSKNYQISEEEVRLAIELRDACWKHGIKLGVYLRGDLIYAEFFGDLLKTEDILAKRADGRVPTAGMVEEWRKCVCFHKPKVMEMFKADIRRAVVELKVDYLHFDGFEFGGMETFTACRCESCRRDFTEFRRRRYRDHPEACIRRFGHHHLEAIEPPGMVAVPSIPAGLITEPVWQEWISFRCTWSARFVRTVYEYAYSLRPEVAIGVNQGLPVRENGPLLIGLDVVSHGDGADIMMNEDAYGPYIADDGKIIQRVRQHKMTHEAGCWALNYMDHWSASSWIGLAHASAFNKGRITYLGRAKSSFLDWQKEHWQHFQDLEDIVDVAVWRERKAMAFADPMSYATAMQVEQLLIEDRIPFTVAQRAWPAETKVVVLPALTCLDEASCRKVMEFAAQGGGVLVIGNTSLRDGWGRRRADFGLRPILSERVAGPMESTQQHLGAVNAPVQSGPQAVADSDSFQYHKTGRGRVAYVRELVDPKSQPSLFNPDHTFNVDLDTTNWRPPEDADNLRRALGWLQDNRRSIRVESVRGVLANYYRQTTTGNWSVHLVNLTGKPVANTVVRMDTDPAATLTVTAISPDGEPCRKVSWRVSGSELTISLEALVAYTVIVIGGHK